MVLTYVVFRYAFMEKYLNSHTISSTLIPGSTSTVYIVMFASYSLMSNRLTTSSMFIPISKRLSVCIRNAMIAT